MSFGPGIKHKVDVIKVSFTVLNLGSLPGFLLCSKSGYWPSYFCSLIPQRDHPCVPCLSHLLFWTLDNPFYSNALGLGHVPALTLWSCQHFTMYPDIETEYRYTVWCIFCKQVWNCHIFSIDLLEMHLANNHVTLTKQISEMHFGKMPLCLTTLIQIIFMLFFK